MKIQSTNELAELGNVINEMSSNLQEIILLSKNIAPIHWLPPVLKHIAGLSILDGQPVTLFDCKTPKTPDQDNPSRTF